MIKKSASRRSFEVFNIVFMILLSFIMLYPFYYCLIGSFSANGPLLSGKVSMWPIGFNTEAYRLVFGYKVVWNAYMYTIIYTVLGTFINLLLTILGAYPLSRSDFYGKGVFTAFIAVTMFFNAGLIPTFLTIRDLHLYDTIWALVLPGGISTMNMIIMRTFFQGIPDALEEAATIDGASDSQVLMRIILPLSLPSIMTIGLFYAVGHWNGWFNAMIYLNDSKRYPLQLILRQIVLQNQVNDMVGTMAGYTTEDSTQVIAESIKYAVIIVAVTPILCVYPFIQKYFAKGVMIGSIKG